MSVTFAVGRVKRYSTLASGTHYVPDFSHLIFPIVKIYWEILLESVKNIIVHLVAYVGYASSLSNMKIVKEE